jgi:uronate dehydrogenase
MKTVLITGAAGGVGTFLRREWAGRYRLRLSDVRPIAELVSNETFVAADIASMAEVTPIVAGVDAIVHLGGFGVEGPWDTILPANIVGTYNVFEAARAAGVKRIVFASSNHAMGFYSRDETIDHTAYPKPDSRYGVSKVFGEALASLYADKYAMQMFVVRIGNVWAQPADKRRLAIWVSPRDLAQLFAIGIEHPAIRFEIVYGMSDNKRAWWDNANARRLGFAPQDRSEDYATDVLAREPATLGHPLADALQGGAFVVTEAGGDPLKEAK